jgi:hypothetical protein
MEEKLYLMIVSLIFRMVEINLKFYMTSECLVYLLNHLSKFSLLSRLRILRAGDFCLTQEGKSVGNADVAFEVIIHYVLLIVKVCIRN